MKRILKRDRRGVNCCINTMGDILARPIIVPTSHYRELGLATIGNFTLRAMSIYQQHRQA